MINQPQQPGDKVKALFFAQYLGQGCQSFRALTDNLLPPYKVNATVIQNIENGNYPEAHLQLRSIDMLTDEECINIAAFRGWNAMLNEKGNAKAVRRWISEDINGEYNRRDFYSTIAISDYLRAIGILLPFTYLDENNNPITLTPDEIVELGWAVVK